MDHVGALKTCTILGKWR